MCWVIWRTEPGLLIPFAYTLYAKLNWLTAGSVFTVKAMIETTWEWYQSSCLTLGKKTNKIIYKTNNSFDSFKTCFEFMVYFGIE